MSGWQVRPAWSTSTREALTKYTIHREKIWPLRGFKLALCSSQNAQSWAGACLVQSRPHQVPSRLSGGCCCPGGGGRRARNTHCNTPCNTPCNTLLRGVVRVDGGAGQGLLAGTSRMPPNHGSLDLLVRHELQGSVRHLRARRRTHSTR